MDNETPFDWASEFKARWNNSGYSPWLTDVQFTPVGAAYYRVKATAQGGAVYEFTPFIAVGISPHHVTLGYFIEAFLQKLDPSRGLMPRMEFR